MKFVVDLPFRHYLTNDPRISWGPGKTRVFTGAILPSDLRPYRSQDYSLGRYYEDELNGHIMPPEKGTSVFKPHPHQASDAKKISEAYDNGWRGFLLASKTGVGKTLSALTAVCLMAKKAGFTRAKRAKLLVVCPKGVIPVWRQTLQSYPPSSVYLRVVIINYESARKLLSEPSNARMQSVKKRRTKNRITARKGQPMVDWDFIIFDEAHYLKNYPKSEASLVASSVAQLNKPYVKGKSPFVIYATATPGATPLNFAVMSGILAPLLAKGSAISKIGPNEWGGFLEKIGFAVKKGKVDYSWITVPWYGKNSSDPKEKAKYLREEKKVKEKQRVDSRRIGEALSKTYAPFIMRSPKDIAGWPEQQIIPYFIDLAPQQIPVYEAAWTKFRDWLRLTPAKKDPKGALVQQLRYRQKTSLLKVDGMIEQIVDWVDSGNQVYISVEFIETLQKYKEALTKHKIKVSEISGRTAKEKEFERIKFQKGESKVILSTVVAGISLHSEEILPDGSRATSAPRITVLADIRQNNLDSVQALGRAHRDGKNSIAYIPVISNTVDERVAESFINKTTNMKTMMAEKDANDLEVLFRDAAEKTTPRNKLS